MGGDTSRWKTVVRPNTRFNRRWRFLGGDTPSRYIFPGYSPPFQSQVAILGWGYEVGELYIEAGIVVSIAGGDSWVGIPCQY